MFANWKKSKKDFCFWKKEEKQKQCSVLLLEGSILEAGLTWATRRTPPSSFPDNYTLHLSIKLPEPWTMCVSICALFHQSLLMNVKEETEKAGLKLNIQHVYPRLIHVNVWQKPLQKEKKKLNIQKTKIMACGPITSWKIDGKTVETLTDYFLRLQNHCRGWLQPQN